MDNGSKIDENAGKSLCVFCFDSILAHLKDEDLPKFPKEEVEDVKYPLFVTWLIGEDKDLRGCIGTFAEQSISKNIQKYALISAFQDTRFSPIEETEVKDLHCGLSLLWNFTPIEDPLNWEVGKHGIEIDFKSGRRSYSGTFLPEVAKEQGWDQRETLEYLVRKAGFYGSLDEVLDQINCKTYESLKFNMSYDEYKEHKGN